MAHPTGAEPYPQPGTVSTHQTLLTDAATNPARRSVLCQRYAAAVYWHYRGFYRGHPNARETAEELMHEFLLHFFLDRDPPRFTEYITGSAARGRFLHYVLRASENYRLTGYKKENAIKRGGGRGRIELDADPDRYAGVLEAPGLSPDEQAERAFTLDRLWRAAVQARERLEAPPDRPVDLALFACHQVGKSPDLAAIAKAHKVTAGFVRVRWDALRADRALLPYLTDPPPPYTELAARLGQSVDALATRFSHLRGEVRHALYPLLAEELDADDAAAAAAEAARLLDVLGQIVENARPA